MLLPVFERRVNNEKSLYFADDWILVKVTRIGHIGRGGSVTLDPLTEDDSPRYSIISNIEYRHSIHDRIGCFLVFFPAPPATWVLSPTVDSGEARVDSWSSLKGHRSTHR
jgi:hypothetical protein